MNTIQQINKILAHQIYFLSRFFDGIIKMSAKVLRLK
jgi:hypothetical protein